MSTSLTTAKVVPVNEPYTAMGNRFVHTGGGDMDGTVHRTGGKAILEECQKSEVNKEDVKLVKLL